MRPIVVVQHIHTKWTKRSRGGENAVKRNGLPEAAKVPVQRIVEGDLILVRHSHSYREANGFRQPHEEIRVNPTMHPLTIGCVTIDHSAEEAFVTFRYGADCAGAPDRGWARKTFRLAVSEWGQMVYNGRFSPDWEGDWWYEKMVVNVGVYQRLTPAVFTQREPTCRFAAPGELF